MRGVGGGSFAKPEHMRRDPRPLREVQRVTGTRVPGDVPEPALPLDGPAYELWARLWSYPVSELWSTADVAGLTRLVTLQTSPELHGSARVLAELRQLEDRYYANPVTRRAQRVEIGGDEPEPVDAAEVAIAEYRLALGVD